MQFVATDAARSVVCDGRTAESCKNGRTDRDAFLRQTAQGNMQAYCMGVHIGANWRIRLRAVRGGDAAFRQIASEYLLNVFAARRCATYMHSAVCAVARCYVETPELIELGLGAEAALACHTSF